MRLYVTRHGKAETDAESGRDADRRLRKRGVRQAEWLASHVAGSRDRPKIVYSSSLTRSAETARIIAGRLDVEIREEPVLGLGHAASDVVELLDVLLRRAEFDATMLIGHNPQLENLVAVLVEGPGGRPPRIRTGESVLLETPASSPLIGRCEHIETIRDPGD